MNIYFHDTHSEEIVYFKNNLLVWNNNYLPDKEFDLSPIIITHEETYLAGDVVSVKEVKDILEDLKKYAALCKLENS